MKNKHTKIALAADFMFALTFTFSCSGGDDNDGSLLSYQGKTYKTVKIGNQTWMAENLNYDVSCSKCYDNKESNCNTYGRLYSWATAMGIEAKYNNAKWAEVM